MKKLILFTILIVRTTILFSQSLNLTGGVSVTKATIDTDVLNQVIQQKQEEVFARVFSNIVVKYFRNSNKTPENGVYNFPTYFGLYNLMTDLTVGKTKTTVSKAVMNSAAELAYIYAFAKYCQDKQSNTLVGIAAVGAATKNRIDNIQTVTRVSSGGKVTINTLNLLSLNFYMEAAYDVLAKNKTIQDKFHFKRGIDDTEIKSWYNQLGLINNNAYNNKAFNDVTGASTTLPNLIAYMNNQVSGFLTYAGNDTVIKGIIALSKSAVGFEELKKDEINAVKLGLLEYANSTDYLFDQNIVKNILNVVVENTLIGASDGKTIDQVYIDVEGLILSIDKDIVSKSKKSSVSSALFFVNPRPFFTIGSSTDFFLDKNNTLGQENNMPVALSNVNFASEKIGFKVKLWDGGYTNSFGPGEVYKWHGKNYVWTQPQPKPLISSVYYNFYASGLLYNVVNLKTNKNFDYAILSSNIGLIFFNGLEFSTGIGAVYNNGFDSQNLFLKIDFDIPIIDYLTALKNKRKN